MVDRSRKTPAAAELEGWLLQRLSNRLGIPQADLDPAVPFADYGLDSRNAVGLSGDLEDWLGRKLSPTLAWDYPTVRSLAAYLASAPGDAAGEGEGDWS